MIRVESNHARMITLMCSVGHEDRISGELRTNALKSFIRNRQTHAGMENRRYNGCDD